MSTIFLYGDSTDDAIEILFIKILAQKYYVTFISDTQISEYGLGNTIDLTLISSNEIREINKTDAIIVFKPHSKINRLQKLDSSSKVIISSLEASKLLKLPSPLNNVYTCGFSSKDYITFSSREEDKAVISLQRSVLTLCNEVCDPFELPCSISKITDDFPLLAAMMTLILLEGSQEKLVHF